MKDPDEIPNQISWSDIHFNKIYLISDGYKYFTIDTGVRFR